MTNLTALKRKRVSIGKSLKKARGKRNMKQIENLEQSQSNLKYKIKKLKQNKRRKK